MTFGVARSVAFLSGPYLIRQQVLLHHWSVACKGFGRQRGHRSGMKLLLELPEFTSGPADFARSWPIGRWVARCDYVRPLAGWPVRRQGARPDA